jgi:hypothetical protein
MNRLSRPKHLAFLLALALACTMVLAFAMLQNPSEQRYSKNGEKPTKDQLIAQAADLNKRINVVRANSSLSELETLLGEMIDVLETQLAQTGPNDEASGNRYSLFTTYVELSLVMGNPPFFRVAEK